MLIQFQTHDDMQFSAAMRNIQMMTPEQRQSHLIESVKYYHRRAEFTRQAEQKVAELMEASCVRN